MLAILPPPLKYLALISAWPSGMRRWQPQAVARPACSPVCQQSLATRHGLQGAMPGEGGTTWKVCSGLARFGSFSQVWQPDIARHLWLAPQLLGGPFGGCDRSALCAGWAEQHAAYFCMLLRLHAATLTQRTELESAADGSGGLLVHEL